MKCPVCDKDCYPSTSQCSCGYVFKPAPRKLAQKKGSERKVLWVFGYLVIIVAAFLWYQSSQLSSSAQIRTQEESSAGEQQQQQESNGAEGSFPMVPGTMPEEVQPAQSREAAAEDRDVPAKSTTAQTAPSQLIEDTSATTNPEDLADASLSERYTIQVGVFGSEEAADRVLSQLSATGYSGPARIEQPERGTDRFYRVWVGEFITREQASRFQTQLKIDGFETYIRKMAGP